MLIDIPLTFERATLARRLLRASAALAVLTLHGCQDPNGGDPPVPQDLIWSLLEPGSAAKPGVDPVRGTVFFYNGVRDLVALDALTGAVKWRHPGGGTGGVAPGTDIVVVRDVVAVGDGGVSGHRSTTGELLWIHARGGEGDRPIASDGSALYLASQTGFISKVDPLTGQDFWAHSLAHGDTAVAAFGPSVLDNRVYACANRYRDNDGGVSRGALSALDAVTGNLLWRYDYEPERPDRPLTWCFTPPATINGLVVTALVDGRIIAHDQVDGSVRWTSPSETPPAEGGSEFRYLASDGTYLIATSGQGNITSLDPATGSVIWRTSQSGSTPLSTPTIGSGLALVTHSPPVVAYDLKSGVAKWWRPADTEYVTSAPPYRTWAKALVHNDIAYWVASDGIRAKRIQ